jgi:KDO2-lipid IV(A) lauroyltransferase
MEIWLGSKRKFRREKSLKKKRLITKRLKNWIVYRLARVSRRLFQVLPRNFCLALLPAIGVSAYYLLRRARLRTTQHLTQVFGKEKSPEEIGQMAKEVFHNLGRNAVDVFRMKQVVGKNPERWISCHGLQYLDRAMARGKGVILISGHLGAWELMAGYISAKGYPLSVIATPLDDPRLEKMLIENRTSVGIKNIPRSSGARRILQALRRGEIVGIVMDQDTHVDGVFVDFLGTLAYTPVGPAVFAMKTGAVVVPIAIHIGSDNHHIIEVDAPIDIEVSGNPRRDRYQNTLRCSKAIEKFIRKYPTQWAWMHRRWKRKPEGIPIAPPFIREPLGV